jgi:uncharacterized protein (TIGR02099 family)
VAVLIAFLCAVLLLRHAVLPGIDRYRDQIVASMSRASGMAVSVGDVSAGWEGLRPRLALTGVRVEDRRGKAAFGFERLEVTLAWWTLLAGDLRFHDVDLYRPELRLRRGRDGLLYLADKPLNAPQAGEDGALLQWLLSQPSLGIHEATLHWQDDLSGAPDVALTAVDIEVRKTGRRHRAALQAQAPPEIAGRLDLRADVAFAREGTQWQAAGTVYAVADRADLARLRAYVPVPPAFRSAAGRFRAWVDFEPGRVREVTADVSLRGVHAQLADDALPLQLETLSGRAFYRVQEGGFSAGTRGLAFRTTEGIVSDAGDFSVAVRREAGRAPRGEARANGVDLKIAAALIDYLPVTAEAKARVRALAPRGQLLDSSLVWTGETLAAAQSFRVRARFEDVGVNAAQGLPGATGLSGSLDGDEAGGRLRISSAATTFDASSVFREPLAFDALDARASWKRGPDGLEVKIEEARLANADATLAVAGAWRSLPQSANPSPGWVDLSGRIERAKAAAVARYLPNAIAQTRTWLERAVGAGELSRGRFELKGDLWQFPFTGGQNGRFFVEAAIEGGQLEYDPAWPAVRQISGAIRFENARMEIAAREATVYASRARMARAVIADLGATPAVLELEAEIDSTGGDGARFLRETPLVEGPGGFTRAVSVEGPARLKLRMTYPLSGPNAVRLSGDYSFAGATASVGRSLVLTGIRGNLAFTERSVRAPELAGTMFGQPAALRLSTQSDGSVLTQLEGRLGAGVLGAFIPEAFARRTAGTTEWKARVVTDAAGTELRVDSSLKGLAIGLPEPFGKLADESRPMTVAVRRLGRTDEETVASLAGGVHARIGRAGEGDAARWHAALRFGSPVTSEPVRDGLWLYGDIDRFDLDAWREALAPPGAAPAADASPPALELRGVDLRFGRLRYTGRELLRLEAKLRREGEEWNGVLGSPSIAGEVSFNPTGRGRVTARLQRFSLMQGTSGAAGPEPAPTAAPGALPELDIVAERFEFAGRWLGRLDLKARHDGDDWRIDRLDIANPHARFASTGSSRPAATGQITRLDLKLDTGNLSALMGQFGFGEYITRGEGGLEGSLVWPGYPYEFSTASLSGRFKVEASRGQFAKIEPGAGKLLGLLSLQSIPRRVTFDFRDIFSEGLAFDRISGDVRLARGVLLTQDFEIAGPSAFVSMAGEVSLPLETQNLTLRVVPEVGESVAIAATFLGTPVLGLTTLLLQKLLQNPIGKVVSYEYLVTGSWDNPAVTRLGAVPRPSEAPKAAAPAKQP